MYFCAVPAGGLPGLSGTVERIGDGEGGLLKTGEEQNVPLPSDLRRSTDHGYGVAPSIFNTSR